jgi:hypothetical protein
MSQDVLDALRRLNDARSHYIEREPPDAKIIHVLLLACLFLGPVFLIVYGSLFNTSARFAE